MAVVGFIGGGNRMLYPVHIHLTIVDMTEIFHLDDTTSDRQ